MLSCLLNGGYIMDKKELKQITTKVYEEYGFVKKGKYYYLDLKDVIIIGNDMNDVDMFKLPCGYKIATGINQPPKELLDLADKYVKLDDLPNFISQIDRNGI